MEYINHYTLNTGDNRKSLPSEVNKDMYFVLKRMIDEAKRNEFADVLDGTVMKLTIEDNSYAITLFNNSEEKIPLLTTLGCSDGKDAAKTLKEANRLYKSIYNQESKISPITPFCIDVILPSIIFNPKVSAWTDDLCRCMAWVLLAPEMIKEKL